MLQQPSQFNFGPIEEQARSGFTQRIIPSIAERFTALGAQRSSAFPQLLGQAGSDLESQLAAMKSQYKLQNQAQQQQLLLSLLGLGLTPQFQSAYFQRQPGAGEGIAQGILSSLPYLAAIGAKSYLGS